MKFINILYKINHNSNLLYIFLIKRYLIAKILSYIIFYNYKIY